MTAKTIFLNQYDKRYPARGNTIGYKFCFLWKVQTLEVKFYLLGNSAFANLNRTL